LAKINKKEDKTAYTSGHEGKMHGFKKLSGIVCPILEWTFTKVEKKRLFPSQTL